jgi:hypothetical protein
MLTYALVDRCTVNITGLEQQTNDKARVGGQYYSDKLPGYSFVATVPYAAARLVLRLPAHPLGQPALHHWAADYWVTLAVSGLLTAWTGALLSVWARDLGCGPTRAVLVGIMYGLATPAYAYATLAYGHQATAFVLFASFFLLARSGGPSGSMRMFLAGFLAAYAAVIELQVGPVSAILALYLLVECLRGTRRLDALALFALGAVPPVLVLLAYNALAFGSPWQLGYFHHATRDFYQVHNPANPLGLVRPDLHKLVPLLWGRYRGLAFYAPCVLLTIPGWLVLLARRLWGVAIVSFLAVAVVLLVNLSYPQWTGGWSTGPRLLVPLLPFAVLPVAALLAGDSPRARTATAIAAALALAGGVLMLLFQGAGARIPQDALDPIRQVVWPCWTGELDRPGWWAHERFCRNLISTIAPGWIAHLAPASQAVQFLPLVVGQTVALLACWRQLAGTRSGD